jgi:hypothetical protein
MSLGGKSGGKLLRIDWNLYPVLRNANPSFDDVGFHVVLTTGLVLRRVSSIAHNLAAQLRS